MTGLRRLQLYDDQFKTFRDELRENRKADSDWQKSTREEFNRTAAKLVTDKIDDEREAFRTEASDAQKKVEAAVAQLEDFRSKNAWLIESAALLEGYGSIGQVHKTSEKLFRDEKPNEAAAIIRRALTDELRGTEIDFFNLGSELGRNDQETLAFEVSDAGLSLYPRNDDLLANTIKFATSCGNQKRAEELFSVAEARTEEGISGISWRLATFTADYLETFGDDSRVRDWYDKFVNYWHGLAEHGAPISTSLANIFVEYASYVAKFGEQDRALQLLTQARELFPSSPQVFRNLAELYRDLGRDQEEIEAINKALGLDTATQSTVDVAGLLWRRGSLSDRRLTDAIDAQMKTGRFDQSNLLMLARFALVDYARAGQSPDRQPIMTFQLSKRANAIVACLELAGIDQATINETVPRFFTDNRLVRLGERESARPGNSGGRDNLVEQITSILSAVPEEDLANATEKLVDQLREMGESALSHVSTALQQRVDSSSDPQLAARLRMFITALSD